MKMKTFDVEANGTLMGEYKGETAANAIDAYAREAGYQSFSHMAQEVGATKEELAINLIDSAKLVEAVEKTAGLAVLQDAYYGQGVALVDSVSYTTHRELAEAFGLSINDFFVS